MKTEQRPRQIFDYYIMKTGLRSLVRISRDKRVVEAMHGGVWHAQTPEDLYQLVQMYDHTRAELEAVRLKVHALRMAADLSGPMPPPGRVLH